MSASTNALPHQGVIGVGFDYHRRILSRAFHFVIVIAADTHVTQVSPEIAQFLGHDPALLIGEAFVDYVHPADQERAIATVMREIMAPEALAPSATVRVRHANGTWRDIEAIGYACFDDPLIEGLVIGCRDVTGSSVSDRNSAANEYLFRSLATSASDGTCIFDASGKRVYSSPSLGAVLGYTTTELNNIGASQLVLPEDMHLWKRATREALESERGFARVECRLLRRDGTIRWIETTVVNLLQDPSVQGVVAHIRDIDDRVRLEAELRRSALTDALTGLSNRAALMNALRMHTDDSRAVLFCDLDGFKAVNDRFGHEFGDRMLREVADAIRAATTGAACTARIGGDEFCVLLVGSDEVELARRSTMLREAVLATAEQHGVGISIGVAVAQPGDPVDDVLVRSDHAMYRAKRTARNLIEYA